MHCHSSADTLKAPEEFAISVDFILYVDTRTLLCMKKGCKMVFNLLCSKSRGVAYLTNCSWKYDRDWHAWLRSIKIFNSLHIRIVSKCCEPAVITIILI